MVGACEQYRFGAFVIDMARRELLQDGEPVVVQARVFDLLAYLAKHSDRVVDKNELQDEVWPRRVITEAAMSQAIMKARLAVGDDANEPAIIKTVYGKGFRFVATVEIDESIRVEASNFRQPSRVVIQIALAVLAIALILVLRASWFSEPVANKSIAVLPFDDMSEAQDQRWFADGLAEEILNSLARTPDLLVAARTSSFSFRDSTSDIPTIAKALGVAHILEGSIRRDSGQIRVTAQLIRTHDGFHLWSESYDYRAEDLIHVQESIAISIANALETAMDPDALATLVSSGTLSVPAFEAYLEGLAGYATMVQTGNVQSYVRSIEAFEHAVELDPEFALAYGEIALYWITQSSAVAIGPKRRNRPLAEVLETIRQALDGAIRHSEDPIRKLSFQVTRAMFETQLRRALQLNTEFLKARPHDKFAQGRQLNLLAQLNRFDEVVSTAFEFLDRDGFDPVVAGRSIHTMIYSNDMSAIRLYVDRIVDRLEHNTITTYQAHRGLLWSGEVERARVLYEELLAGELSATLKAHVRLRQLCAEHRIEEAERLYEETNEAFANSRSFRWMSSATMGYTGRGLELLQRFDAERNFNALAGFLLYGTFDPGPLPNFMAHLETHGNETGHVTHVPFRCVQDH